MNGLDKLRGYVAKALTGLAFFHVPILVIAAFAFDRSPLGIGIAALAFAMGPLLIAAMERPPRVIGFFVAVALISQTALLVYVFEGHPWQVEMHFYFFANLAMLSGFCDPWILIAGAALVAVHHLVLNGWIPEALYPGGTDILRLVLHATIVVIETAMLVVIAKVIEMTFEEVSLTKAAVTRLSEAGTTLEQQLEKTTKRANHFEASLAAFRGEVASSLTKLVVASKTLNLTADDFSAAAMKTLLQTKAVASAAEGANQRVSDVASAGRAYVGTMSEISEHMLLSAGMGRAAVSEVEATTASIDDLALMSVRIATSTKLIAGIANQTNLLSLNATIEAVRAGQHGRGFSVVAAEVKSLASETSKAAGTIAELVNGIQGSTTRSIAAMSSIVAAISGLNKATTLVSSAVDERVVGAAQMAKNVDAAAADVQKVATAIEAIERVNAESAKGAGAIRLAASEISDQTEAIRLHVESFTADLIKLELNQYSAPNDLEQHTERQSA